MNTSESLKNIKNNTITTDNEPVNIQRYFSLFISNWYWFAIALFISISIAYGINRWSEEVYTVSSTLLIKDDQNGALTEIFPGSEGFRNQQKVNNEIGILKSFNLNYRVMKELPEFQIVYTSIGRRGIAESRLYKTAPFIIEFNSLEHQAKGKKVYIKILSREKFLINVNNKDFQKEMKFGQRFNAEGFDFVVSLRNSNYVYNDEVSNKYYFYFIDPSTLANQYRNKLSVDPAAEESSLVVLRTTGYVPEQEADFLNMLMKVYLEFGLEYKNQTAAQTINFIEEQLNTISDSLKIAESVLERFRLDNKLIDISREGTTIQNKLEIIDEEKTRLTLQKKYYEYLQDYVGSRSEEADIIAPSVVGIADDFLMRLVEELSEMQKQKRQLSMTLVKSADPLKILEINISKTRLAINDNIKNGLSNTERLITDANKRIENIDLEIQRLPSTERQMINIQRKFDINNTVYTFLLEKRAEAGIAKASNVPDNRIIDLAGVFSSSRIRPREKRNIMTGIIIGLLLPFMIIILFDYLNNKIIDKVDVEKATTIPIIGYVNHNTLSTELPVSENLGSTLSESFRSIRTNLKQCLIDKQNPVVSISSTLTGEGKTFVSVNLASIIAISGKRTLLVGLDLRKPRIHRIFGMNNDEGISNYLIGQISFEDVVKKTIVDNLWYAPSGAIPPNPAELIESDSMNKFIEIAKNNFDYIIIDTPPIAIVTDALLVSHLTDYYLFVVRQRYSSKNTLELINEITNNRDNKFGIIINDISLSGYYGYGLRYGYALGYGYNYGYSYYEQYNLRNSKEGYYK